MITCLKHKVEFVKGECPSCKRLREGISVSYKTNTPQHTSRFIMDRTKELNELADKVKKVNDKLKKLLKDNK